MKILAKVLHVHECIRHVTRLAHISQASFSRHKQTVHRAISGMGPHHFMKETMSNGLRVIQISFLAGPQT